MSTLQLTYFDSPGRAEPIRVALFMGGLAFQDRRLKFPEFAEARAQGDFPLGAVPVLDVDGVKIVQTAAILRYVARIGDQTLYPTDPWSALLVDSALDSFNDTLSQALMPSLFERDASKKLAMRAEFAAGPMARVMTYCEGLVGQSAGPFVSGTTLSIADIVIALQVLQIRSGILDGLTTAMLEPYPLLNALADAYSADARVVAYKAR
ncbi:MAG: glutathione S-transferase family protein [Myxococcales bacterium]|nr:glutathione S-transferase family protein [Myxococcales bacterium]